MNLSKINLSSLKKLLKKIDRNYYLIIGFWLIWKITTTFVVFIGSVYFNGHLLDHTFLENTYRVWNWWDSGFFSDIAKTGYKEPSGSHFLVRTAFFPLFPALIRFISHILNGNISLAQYLIANTSFLTWVVLLYYFLKEFICSNKKQLALNACILSIVFPYSFFFAAGYAESLFLVFVLLFFIALYKKRYFLSAICIALASVTRFVGIGLLLILIIDIFLLQKQTIKKIFYSFFCSVISISLVVFYSVFLQIQHGKWNWFLLAEESWGRKLNYDFLTRYYHIINNDLIHANHHSILFLNDVFNLSFLILTIAIGLYYLIWNRKYFYFGLYILVMMGPAILNGNLLSMARFSIICFPIYFYLAAKMEKWSLPLSFLLMPFSLIQSVLIVVFTSGIRFIG